MSKRMYIGLPDDVMRGSIVDANPSSVSVDISKADYKKIIKFALKSQFIFESYNFRRLTEGYSASDITAMVREASFIPLRLSSFFNEILTFLSIF